MDLKKIATLRQNSDSTLVGPAAAKVGDIAKFRGRTYQYVDGKWWPIHTVNAERARGNTGFKQRFWSKPSVKVDDLVALRVQKFDKKSGRSTTELEFAAVTSIDEVGGLGGPHYKVWYDRLPVVYLASSGPQSRIFHWNTKTEPALESTVSHSICSSWRRASMPEMTPKKKAVKKTAKKAPKKQELSYEECVETLRTKVDAFPDNVPGLFEECCEDPSIRKFQIPSLVAFELDTLTYLDNRIYKIDAVFAEKTNTSDGDKEFSGSYESKLQLKELTLEKLREAIETYEYKPAFSVLDLKSCREGKDMKLLHPDEILGPLVPEETGSSEFPWLRVRLPEGFAYSAGTIVQSAGRELLIFGVKNEVYGTQACFDLSQPLPDGWKLVIYEGAKFLVARNGHLINVAGTNQRLFGPLRERLEARAFSARNELEVGSIFHPTDVAGMWTLHTRSSIASGALMSWCDQLYQVVGTFSDENGDLQYTIKLIEDTNLFMPIPEKPFLESWVPPPPLELGVPTAPIADSAYDVFAFGARSEETAPQLPMEAAERSANVLIDEMPHRQSQPEQVLASPPPSFEEVRAKQMKFLENYGGSHEKFSGQLNSVRETNKLPPLELDDKPEGTPDYTKMFASPESEREMFRALKSLEPKEKKMSTIMKSKEAARDTLGSFKEKLGGALKRNTANELLEAAVQALEATWPQLKEPLSDPIKRNAVKTALPLLVQFGTAFAMLDDQGGTDYSSHPVLYKVNQLADVGVDGALNAGIGDAFQLLRPFIGTLIANFFAKIEEKPGVKAFLAEGDLDMDEMKKSAESFGLNLKQTANAG